MDFNWPSYIFGVCSTITLIVVVVGVFAYIAFMKDRRDEQRREEERKKRIAEEEKQDLVVEESVDELKKLKEESNLSKLEHMPDDSTIH